MSKFHLVLVLNVMLALLVLTDGERLLAREEEATDETALVMVIDNSDSMGSNDGENLRYAAARLIMQVADPWDQIGVICFGDSPATMLSLDALGSGADRRSKIDQVIQDSCPVDGGTDMTSGIQEATTALTSSQAPRKYMLVLTDGEPTTGGTIEAIIAARNQDITVIPVALGSGASDFFDELQKMNIASRQVNNSRQLIEEFAAIYAALKPDRYVEVLNTTQNEMRVNTSQQVDRLTFVLPPGESLIKDGVNRECPNDPTCTRDPQRKYDLMTFDESPVEGRWELTPNGSAVVITKANFRPVLAYPPTDDPTQTGYYIQRRMEQTIVTRLEGGVSDDAPISINTGRGAFAQAPTTPQTYVFTQFPAEQDNANVQLGEGNTPLVVRKGFSLEPVPDLEPDLPRLEAINPDIAGEVQLEGDGQVRLQINTSGNTDLVTNLSVWAVVIDGDTATTAFGPEPLQLLQGMWQSPTPVQVNPGTSYRVVYWMQATRGDDGLRYGDHIDTSFVLGGAIRIIGLPNLTLADFQRDDVPFTIEVTEPGREVDIRANLIWEEQPPGANAPQSFTVQLRDNQVSHNSGGSTSTALLPTGPNNLCDLPEGRYRGYIEFSTESDLPIVPRRVDVTEIIQCGGIHVLGKNSLTLDDFTADIPYRVGVDAADREVDLDAQLVWEDRPAAAAVADDFQVQLGERFFSNPANETTETVLLTSAPEDLCALPEGNYNGYIEFTTSSDAPITPNRIPIVDRINYGDIQVLTEESIDLGLHCSLSGWWNALCFNFGNEAEATARFDVEVPACVNPANIETTVTSIDPPEAEPPRLSAEKIDRSSDPVQIEVRALAIPPIQFFADFNRRRQFNGEMAVGRIDQQGQPDLAQFSYAKQSVLDTLIPVPFAVSWRLGNWLSSGVLLVGIVSFFRYLSGETDAQRKSRGLEVNPRRPVSRRARATEEEAKERAKNLLRGRDRDEVKNMTARDRDRPRRRKADEEPNTPGPRASRSSGRKTTSDRPHGTKQSGPRKHRRS